jgi:uncharacterized OB-fold protein
MGGKTEKPFLPGWFGDGEGGAHLIGSRCTGCGTYYFPREARACRNPACGGEQFEAVPLSRHGRLWSYTNACYQPPEPYVSPEPFVPFAVAAVELEREKMVVLGPVVPGVEVASLRVGMPMELVIATLSETPTERHLAWNWKPSA